MTAKELEAFHEMMCKKARDVMVKKNHDYAGADGTTPFLNFEVTERVGIGSTEQGFLVRIMDKIMRLNTFIHCGELKVENESTADACLDILNYVVLLAAYLHHKNPQNKV